MTDTVSIDTGSLEGQALTALLNIVKSSTSPDVLQAQAIMLRRLAMEGDAVPSRIPAPLNISEIGGYINLVTDLGMTDIRSQMISGVLGVAGPPGDLGWLQSEPTVGWVDLPNDRPAGPRQATVALTFQTRSDFSAALQLALQALHDHGCALPIFAPAQSLPSAGSPAPKDVLPLIGRELMLAPTMALADPDNDPIAVAQLPGGPWQVVARCASTGPVAVNPGQWSALVCGPTSCSVSPPPASGRKYVPVEPILSSAGFVPASPGCQPTSALDYTWARFTNQTGLVAGISTLGNELVLLYPQSAVATSALSGMVGDLWNGSSFGRA